MVTTMTKPKIKVKQFHQEDEGFWVLMGRYFASAKVKRELGIAMSSDETYAWFLAFQNDSLVGFCAVTPEKTANRLRHVYVHPEMRGRGSGKELVKAAIKAAEFVKKPLVVTVKTDAIRFYESLGFTSTGKVRGQYVDMVKNGESL